MKFRIWSIDENEYIDYEVFMNIEGDLVCHETDGVDCFMSILDKEKYIIEHSLGIRDKDGKEIYEGDIVNVYYADLYNDRTIIIQSLIATENRFNNCRSHPTKIIGNIHKTQS